MTCGEGSPFQLTGLVLQTAAAQRVFLDLVASTAALCFHQGIQWRCLQTTDLFEPQWLVWDPHWRSVGSQAGGRGQGRLSLRQGALHLQVGGTLPLYLPVVSFQVKVEGQSGSAALPQWWHSAHGPTAAAHYASAPVFGARQVTPTRSPEDKDEGVWLLTEWAVLYGH